MDVLERFAEIYESDPQFILDQVAPSGVWPAEPEFVVEFREEDFGVFEVKTGTFLRLGP
jgi:hypothetical protein